VFRKNLTHFRAVITRAAGLFRVARTRSEYDDARRAGLHAVMLSIQGGNALQAAPEGVASIPDDVVTRVTVVHLTSSAYGVTSSPLKLWRRGGLTGLGRDFVRQLNDRRVFVDLAHINPKGFWDAVEVHDPSQPLIATHTGVNGVKPHWRNLADDQIRAIADTGGVVGIVFATNFLRPRGGPRDCQMVIDHVQHVIDVAGEDHVSLGSDFDGAIIPPPDLRDGASYPRLAQAMLDRGWSTARIQKVLGANYLRAFGQLRP
jgi:membrane dipeptidase